MRRNANCTEGASFTQSILISNRHSRKLLDLFFRNSVISFVQRPLVKRLTMKRNVSSSHLLKHVNVLECANKKACFCSWLYTADLMLETSVITLKDNFIQFFFLLLKAQLRRLMVSRRTMLMSELTVMTVEVNLRCSTHMPSDSTHTTTSMPWLATIRQDKFSRL